jgi:hypothetical protein
MQIVLMIKSEAKLTKFHCLRNRLHAEFIKDLTNEAGHDRLHCQAAVYQPPPEADYTANPENVDGKC